MVDPGATTLAGRYALLAQIATGGMATVHLGRLLGSAGFSRLVAIKRLHPQFAGDENFVSMFLDEARLAARVSHPSVVQIIDVVQSEGETFLVMEYVAGESLGWFIRQGVVSDNAMPVEVAVALMIGALNGLHAAHEATTEEGTPLHIVHRDVSPQNILVAPDGAAKVLDFGIAKAAIRSYQTQEGQLKGKLAYMAPEQFEGHTDRRVDVYAAGLVLWEALVGRRLFKAKNEAQLVAMITAGQATPPGQHRDSIPAALDEAVMWALAADPSLRCPTALDLADAIERAVRPASQRQLREWIDAVGREQMAAHTRRIADLERQLRRSAAPPAPGVLAALPTLPAAQADPRPLDLPAPPQPTRSEEVPTLPTLANPALPEVVARSTLADPAPPELVPLAPAPAGPTAPAAGARPAAGWRWAALAAAAAGALAAWGLRAGEPARPPGQPAGQPSAAAPAARASLDPPGAWDPAAQPSTAEPPTGGAAGGAASGAAAGAGSASGDASSVAAASAPPPGKDPPPAGQPQRPRAGGGRPPGCDPPYVIENGVKRFKVNCLLDSPR